jgi:hypothetical protein
MKRLLIVCTLFSLLLVLLLGAGSAFAQDPTYQFAEAGTKNFITKDTIAVGGQISLDLWLTNVGEPQFAGGAWIDFTASTAEISYVSGGRCMIGGAEGCTGPWTNGSGALVNEPEGPGTVLLVVANLGGAAPDGAGDLIVGTVTLESIAEGDATVDLTVIPGVATWMPIDDVSISPATLTLSPPSCLVEQMYGEDSVEVAVGRYLRDSVLRKTTEGREIIKIYYDWSPHLVRALEEDTALKDHMKKVLDQILLLIKHERE